MNYTDAGGGQIVGGSVQGQGGALLEEFIYDQQGQLLTGSLMDYAPPRATRAQNCVTRNPRPRSILCVLRVLARAVPLPHPQPLSGEPDTNAGGGECHVSMCAFLNSVRMQMSDCLA
jgi:hypothetical protein